MIMKDAVKKIRGMIKSEFGDDFEIHYRTLRSSSGEEEHAYISKDGERIGSLQYFPECHVSCGPRHLENFMRLRENVARALKEDF